MDFFFSFYFSLFQNVNDYASIQNVLPGNRHLSQVSVYTRTHLDYFQTYNIYVCVSFTNGLIIPPSPRYLLTVLANGQFTHCYVCMISMTSFVCLMRARKQK